MSNDSRWCELKHIEDMLIKLRIGDFGIHSSMVRFNYIYWLASDDVDLKDANAT